MEKARKAGDAILKKLNRLPYKILLIFPLVLSVVCGGVCVILRNDILLFLCVSFLYLVLVKFDLDVLKNKIDYDLDESKATNDLKSSFLANMSHEIRTPINAVLTMDEMILRESNDGNILEYAKDIKRAGESLLVIINDILDFSKIEAGKMKIVPGEYQTGELIKDIRYMFEEKAREKGLKYEVRITKHIPYTLNGDDIRTKQVIINIVNNAIKYTKEGSVIVDFDYSNDKFTITVSDTGIGIKKEDIEKLFCKFERLEEKKNRNIQGTGLGMSITKQLVDLMHGDLSVNSVYGKGSTFIISIPQESCTDKIVREVDITQNADTDKSQIGARNNKERYFYAPDAKVLVVDDNELNLKSMSLILKRNKVRIFLASSGKTCLDFCQKERFDIIFLDHMMPDMDGIETFKILRDNISYKLNKATPVVMLTANAVNGIDKKFKELGFSDYLSKPVDIKMLESMLKKYIPWGNYINNDEVIQKSGEKQNDNKSSQNSADNKYDGQYAAGKDNKPKDLFSFEAGIKNLETEENLKEMINFFYKNHNAILSEIDGFFRAKDIKNYTLKVHSLKSSTGIIGFSKMSYLCEILEKAGKQNNYEYIKRNHHYLRTVCIQTLCLDRIRKYISDSETEKKDKAEGMDEIDEIDKVDKIDDVIPKVNAYIDNGDINGLDEYFDRIEKMLKETDVELYNKVSTAVLKFEKIPE